MITLDIITREDLQQFKVELFGELKKMHVADCEPNLNKKWLRSADVRELLNVSAGTLQNLRATGKLRFTKVGSLMYYKLEDIEMLLDGSRTKKSLV